MSELLVRTKAMMKHMAQSAKQIKIANHWEGTSKRLIKQMHLFDADINSPLWFYSNSFGAGGLNGSALLVQEKSTIQFKMVEYFLKILARLPNFFFVDFFVNLLWKYCLNQKLVFNSALQADRNYKLLCKYAYQLHKNSIDYYNLSSPSIYQQDIVEVSGGRKLSYKTIENFKIFLKIIETVGPKFDLIVEMGSGLGELARIFLSTDTAKKYIIVDVPPALAFAEKLLASEFSPQLISYFSPERKSIEISDRHRCYFITPDQMDLIPKFDLGIDVASFGEMNQDVVAGYVKQFKARGFQHFVSINYRYRKENNRKGGSIEDYLNFFGPQHVAKEKFSYNPYSCEDSFCEDRQDQNGYQFVHFTNITSI